MKKNDKFTEPPDEDTFHGGFNIAKLSKEGATSLLKNLLFTTILKSYVYEKIIVTMYCIK